MQPSATVSSKSDTKTNASDDPLHSKFPNVHAPPAFVRSPILYHASSDACSMICRLLATAAFLFASGKCQSEIATLTSPSAGPSSTVASTRSAVSTHTIDVSYNQSHKFEPDSLKADLGDVIEVRTLRYEHFHMHRADL